MHLEGKCLHLCDVDRLQHTGAGAGERIDLRMPGQGRQRKAGYVPVFMMETGVETGFPG